MEQVCSVTTSEYESVRSRLLMIVHLAMRINLAMAIHSMVGTCIEIRDDSSSYMEHLDQDFLTNDMKDAAKKWLSICRANTYQFVHNFVASGKPSNPSYGDVMILIRNYYHPKISDIPVIYKFNTHTCQAGELVVT